MSMGIYVWNKTSQVLNDLAAHINVYIQLRLCESLCNDIAKGSEISLKGERKSDQAGQSGVHCVLKSMEKAEGTKC